MMRIPWWQRNADAERMQAESQAQLNKHFGAPKHGRLQQHDIVSGLAGQVWLGDQLDNGWIVAKRGIDRFTEDGTGAYLCDRDGNADAEPTQLGAVIFATGYRQQAGFVDPKVVDMRFEREGNVK